LTNPVLPTNSANRRHEPNRKPTNQVLARIISNEDAWRHLPVPESGKGQPLPSWARALAADLPRSTAALLELDLAQRTQGPIDPPLRAAMRWIAAEANRCDYSRKMAEFDAKGAGVEQELFANLKLPGYPGWTAQERAALVFAHKITVDSSAIT